MYKRCPPRVTNLPGAAPIGKNRTLRYRSIENNWAPHGSGRIVTAAGRPSARSVTGANPWARKPVPGFSGRCPETPPQNPVGGRRALGTPSLEGCGAEAPRKAKRSARVSDHHGQVLPGPLLRLHHSAIGVICCRCDRNDTGVLFNYLASWPRQAARCDPSGTGLEPLAGRRPLR